MRGRLHQDEAIFLTDSDTHPTAQPPCPSAPAWLGGPLGGQRARRKLLQVPSDTVHTMSPPQTSTNATVCSPGMKVSAPSSELPAAPAPRARSLCCLGEHRGRPSVLVVCPVPCCRAATGALNTPWEATEPAVCTEAGVDNGPV